MAERDLKRRLIEQAAPSITGKGGISTANTINPFLFVHDAKPLTNGNMLGDRNLDEDDDNLGDVDFDQYD